MDVAILINEAGEVICPECHDAYRAENGGKCGGPWTGATQPEVEFWHETLKEFLQEQIGRRADKEIDLLAAVTCDMCSRRYA
jgi:hypothetical protein